jgi:hypothetical protein
MEDAALIFQTNLRLIALLRRKSTSGNFGSAEGKAAQNILSCAPCRA